METTFRPCLPGQELGLNAGTSYRFNNLPPALESPVSAIVSKEIGE